MSLSAGTRLGPYEILAALGAGELESPRALFSLPVTYNSAYSSNPA